MKGRKGDNGKGGVNGESDGRAGQRREEVGK